MASVRPADSYRVPGRRSTEQIGDREVREKLAERVGRTSGLLERLDGAVLRLEGERGQGRKTRKVFDHLRDCAAAVPVLEV